MGLDVRVTVHDVAPRLPSIAELRDDIAGIGYPRGAA